MTTKLRNPEEIKGAFDELFASITPEEQTEQDAKLLVFSFLSKVADEMEKKQITKKQLAELVETSPSFITQLFNGDRKPSWTLLAKIKKCLNIEFNISTKGEIEEEKTQAIFAAHKTWVNEGYCSVSPDAKIIGHLTVFTNCDYAYAV